MAFNLDDINIDEIIEDCVNETDNELASKISSLTKMTDEEIKELFPKTTDVKNLVELMKIVKSSEDRNTKINKIVSKTEEFSGVVLTLLA